MISREITTFPRYFFKIKIMIYCRIPPLTVLPVLAACEAVATKQRTDERTPNKRGGEREGRRKCPIKGRIRETHSLPDTKSPSPTTHYLSRLLAWTKRPRQTHAAPLFFCITLRARPSPASLSHKKCASFLCENTEILFLFLSSSFFGNALFIILKKPVQFHVSQAGLSNSVLERKSR